MAPHSNTLAWKIPWMEEPGRLESMGSLSQTRLSDFTFTFRFHTMEKEMATHSSVLAWRIPGTEEPGGLPSMGSHRVRHDCSDLAAAAAVLLFCVLSCFIGLQLIVTPWTVAFQAPLSMEFSRENYWSRLPFPTPGNLHDPGIKPMSLLSPALAGRRFTISATWEALNKD